MNDLVTQSAALAVLPVASLPTILAADDKDILGHLLRELENWEPDATTERGRKEIASKAQKVRVAKADFERLSDRLKEDAIKTQRAVNAEFKILEARMKDLIDRVRAPLTEFENREKTRLAGHEAALAAIAEPEGYGQAESAAELRARLDYLNRYPARAWEEFEAKASRTLSAEIDRTAGLLAAAEKREAEAEELVRLRAEQAERDRAAAVEAQRQREEQIAAEAAERAKAEAEAKAAREAAEAEERAQAALRAQAEAAERDRAAALRRDREAAEALARAEQEKRDAEERARKAAIQAEAARVAAEAEAKQQQEAAIEAERQRVAREQAALKAEEDRRAADKAHRGKINREVLADLIAAINDNQGGEMSEEKTSDVAKAVITWIAKGQIRHTAIKY